jgi:hypothetical protein
MAGVEEVEEDWSAVVARLRWSCWRRGDGRAKMVARPCGTATLLAANMIERRRRKMWCEGGSGHFLAIISKSV